MKKFHINELEIYEAEAPFTRQNKIIIDAKNVENPPFSLGMGIYRQGENAQMHVHENEVEVMIFTKGKGQIKLEDGTIIDLEPGLVLYFPPGEPHQIFNTGEGNLEFLFIYSPAGPEAGIREWKVVSK